MRAIYDETSVEIIIGAESFVLTKQETFIPVQSFFGLLFEA